MPVLPDVASSRIERGRRRPFASRSSISARATRSLTEPVGLAASSLANRRTFGFGASLGISTVGVSPIDSTMPEKRLPARAATGAATSAAAGERRQEPDLVAVAARCLVPAEVAHVLAGLADAYE